MSDARSGKWIKFLIVCSLCLALAYGIALLLEN